MRGKARLFIPLAVGSVYQVPAFPITYLPDKWRDFFHACAVIGNGPCQSSISLFFALSREH